MHQSAAQTISFIAPSVLTRVLQCFKFLTTAVTQNNANYTSHRNKHRMERYSYKKKYIIHFS